MTAMDRHEEVVKVCESVKQVLKELPEIAHTNREEFFETGNLWRYQIQSTCLQVQEYYDSVWTLAGRGLLRPAAALSRTIHETSIRLEYLKNQEGSLADWWTWQITRTYFFIADQLRHDELNPLSRVLLRKDKSKCEKLLGEPPPKNCRTPWKCTTELITGAAKGKSEDYVNRWRRLLFNYPSNYVHNNYAQEPTLAYVVGSSQLSVLMTMQVAMEICRDRQLASHETIEAANDIVALCGNLRGVEDHESEP